MKNTKKFILLTCLVAGLTACDKKEILQGKREEFLKTIDKAKNINKELSGVKVQISGATSQSSYVDVNGNKQHNSINHKMSSHSKLLWKTSFGSGPINATPISFGGNIYTIDSYGVLRCLCQKNGDEVWKLSVAPQPSQGSFSGGLTADNGILYITTNIGNVLAIDSKTQKELWSENFKAPLKGAPIYAAGKLIVTTVNNQTMALDAKTGKVVWSKTAGKEEQTIMMAASTPAINGNEVICAYSSGDVTSLSLDNGADVWSDVLFSSNTSESGFVLSHIVASPVINSGLVMVATSEAKTALIDAATGVRIWEQEFGTMNAPVIMNGWAFILSNTGFLTCLSMEDGSIKWIIDGSAVIGKKDEKPAFTSGPIMINGNIAVFDDNGNIDYFDPSTGSFKQQINIGGIISKVPMIIDETMYAMTDRAEIYAIR